MALFEHVLAEFNGPENPHSLGPPTKQRQTPSCRHLAAATGVIDEKGCDATTMAEIAERLGTKIDSLYRFLLNKESTADTLLEHRREYGCFLRPVPSRSPYAFGGCVSGRIDVSAVQLVRSPVL